MNVSATEENLAPVVPLDKRRLFKRECVFALTQDEIREYGKAQARRLREWDALDEKRKQVAGDFKNQLTEVQLDIDRLTNAINSGEEMRNVDVYQVLEGAHMVTRRNVDDVEVDRRPASFADQQSILPGFEPDDAVGDEIVDDDFDGVSDFPTGNEGRNVPVMVTSATGGEVAHMPDDDEGEVPAEEPVAPAPKKRGRPKKKA